MGENHHGRTEYLSFLSVLSSMAVVMLHTNSIFWIFSRSRWWLTANMIESVMYFAVPVFFMISGCTLMDYRSRYSTSVFLKKRVQRTVVPFLFWSILAEIFHSLLISPPDGLRTALENILNCRTNGFFWFFPALFSIYLAIPVVSAVPEEKRRHVYGYGILAAFVLQSLIPFIGSVFNLPTMSSLSIPAVASYLIYPLIGYWIDRYPLSKRWRIVIYIAGLLGLLLHMVGTGVLSWKAGHMDKLFKGYLAPPAMLYSVAIFVAFRYMRWEKLQGWLRRILSPFMPLSFGVYLVQWFVLTTIEKYELFPRQSIVYRTVGAACIYLLCAGVVAVLRRIPLLRKTVG